MFEKKLSINFSKIFFIFLVVSSLYYIVYASDDPYFDAISSENTLISYYRMGESAGATEFVDSENGHNATTANITFEQDGLMASTTDTASLFNGSSGKATTPSGVFDFDKSDSFSFEFLVEPNISRPGGNAENVIFSNINTSSPYNGYEIQLNYNTLVSGKAVLAVYMISNFGTQNYIYVHGNTDLSNGNIYHVVVTYDGTGVAGGLKFYINDTLENLTIVKNNLSGSIISPLDPTIGSRQSTRFLPGTLDELSVYSSVLSPSVVGQHYDASVQPPIGDINPPVISDIASSTVVTTATVTWTTSESSTSKVEYGLTDSYGGESYSATLVSSHSISLSDLDPNSTYHFRISSTDNSGNEAISDDLTFNTKINLIDPTAPVKIILDTDMASDADDIGDIGVLHGLANLDKAEIIAVITSSTNEYSPAAVKAFNTYYGRSSIPIGAYQGNIPSGFIPNDSAYTQTITEEFGTVGDERSNYTDATTIYRQALSSSPDSSVVIVATGFFQPLKDLLGSSGDEISSLTGYQLVAQKVKRLVVVAGIYPDDGGSPEWNFVQDPAGANYVFSNWPTELVSVGIELGNTISTAPPFTDDSAINPLRRAYQLKLGDGFVSREAWGQLGVLYGVLGLSSNFSVAALDGTTSVNSTTGANAWSQFPDSNHAYLVKLESDLNIQNYLNSLLDLDPDTTPPSISSIVESNLGSDSVTISWSTDKTSDSQIEYGLTSSYTTSTTLDTTITSSHSAVLSGLTPGVTYHYRVLSKSTDLNQGYSSDQTFTTIDNIPPVISILSPEDSTTTSGQSVTISSSASDNISVSGVKFYYDDGGVNLIGEDTESPYELVWDVSEINNGTYSILAVAEDTTGNFATSSVNLIINRESQSQSNDEDSNPVVGNTGGGTTAPSPIIPPSGFTIGEFLQDKDGSLLNFNLGVDITKIAISNNLDFNPALYINATDSVRLSNVNEDIFYVKYCNKYAKCSPPISVYSENKSKIENRIHKFNIDLEYGDVNSDVLELQKYLNSNGYLLSKVGVGSVGKETDYFGKMTLRALKMFQEANSNDILKPIGLKEATGYFGISTRNFINNSF